MSKEVQTVLAGMAAGDMADFGKLYDMLSVRIFNYARAITKNKELAEDITHDVFMTIFSNAARLVKIANPTAYIMVITRNHSYDNLRRDKRIAAAPEGVSEMSGPASSHDRLLIEDAFSRLPENQRETAYLHYVCGFTQREVSQIMDAPLVTVKWRCKKALSQLQAYFN